MGDQRVTTVLVQYDYTPAKSTRVTSLVVEYEVGPPTDSTPKRRFGPAAQSI